MISFKQFFTESNQIPDDTPYEVVDRHTGEVIWRGTYGKRNIARQVADRRDNKYGAYRFQARIPTKAMDDIRSKDVIKEYRHNLGDGTSAPSIQAHNGKDPNIIGKKILHTVGDYKKMNPKMNIPGSILTPLELSEMGYEYEHGKILNNVRNSGFGIEMTSINRQPVGRVFKTK